MIDLQKPARAPEEHAADAAAVTPILLRLDGLPATPRNLVRLEERVRQLNDELARSGVPFRLRLVGRGGQKA